MSDTKIYCRAGEEICCKMRCDCGLCVAEDTSCQHHAINHDKNAIEKLEGFTDKDIRILKTKDGVFIFTQHHTGNGFFTKESHGRNLTEAIENIGD